MAPELPETKPRRIMYGLFYVTCILSICLASHETDTIRCNGTPEVIPIQCKNISTGDGYKYPWDVVCDDVIEVYDDSQTPLAKQNNSKLPKQKLCQNLTVKCFYTRDGALKEFCVKFVTDVSMTLLRIIITVVMIVGVIVAAVVVVAVMVLVRCRRQQTQTQNQGEELTELNRPDDGDQPAPGNGGPSTEIGTVTLTNDGAAAAPLDGPRAVDSLLAVGQHSALALEAGAERGKP
ncbi:unnamed protein product [Gadus morhua 'NCC']